MGLFLGYPPFDVKCFMNDSRENVKQVGCWKVYGDEEEAVKSLLYIENVLKYTAER
ncbi:MAG: DUF3793 family protein [Lachnospiraceae bacterium]|nr:DUF3793 family protein [Lachnospiraceae bacterium]